MAFLEMARKILKAKSGKRIKFENLATDLILTLRSMGAHDWGRKILKRFPEATLDEFYEKAMITVDMNGVVTWYFDGIKLGQDDDTLQEKMQKWTDSYLHTININREYQNLPKIPTLWLHGYIGDTKPTSDEELTEEKRF